MYEYVMAPRFEKVFKKKEPGMQAAILRCIKQLSENPRHPGLHAHRMQGTDGVWEAYVDDGNRLTFEYQDATTIVLRNNCNHDMLNRNP